MASFNTVATMRRILRIPAGDDAYTDTEIQEFLDDAQADMFGEIKRQKEIDTFIVDYDRWGSVQKDHKIILAPVISISEITMNGEVISTDDYTLNSDNSIITFDDDILQIGNQVEVFYQPELYKATERYLCGYNMKASSQLLNQDGNEVNITKNYENKYKRNIQVIKNRMQFSTYT